MEYEVQRQVTETSKQTEYRPLAVFSAPCKITQINEPL